MPSRLLRCFRRMSTPLDVAASALASGDPLAALKLIALREDAPALALRGIAMAQLGDFARAQALLRSAERGFGSAQPLARARCILAQTEVGLAARDLRGRPNALGWALRVLEAHGDAVNVAYARLLSIRRALLLGRGMEAERALAALQLPTAPAMLVAIAELIRAELALRRLRAQTAREALDRARAAARRARIPALSHEVEQLARALTTPAARVLAGGSLRSVDIGEVEALLGSPALVIDACRRSARRRQLRVDLERRPVLFALLRGLAERWPDPAPRDELMRAAFGAGKPNASHRARLRVELGRLRREIAALAEIRARGDGYALSPLPAADVVLLLPASDGHDSALLALLADGERWSTSALALALASSQRSVQRALGGLLEAGKVRAHGRGRARRWSAPAGSEFAPALLLPAALPIG
jgi:hypothetical protein